MLAIATQIAVALIQAEAYANLEPTFGSPIDKVQKKYEIGRIIQALRVANYTESLNSKYSVSRTHEVQ